MGVTETIKGPGLKIIGICELKDAIIRRVKGLSHVVEAAQIDILRTQENL